MRRYLAEALGSFAIVFFGCGAALFGLGGPASGAVAAACGAATFVLALALAPVSGAHFNPAISLGMAMTRRLRVRELPAYVAAQIAGATLAAIVVSSAASSRPGGAPRLALAIANGVGRSSPGFFDLRAVSALEIAMTALVVFAALGTTRDSRAPGDELARSPLFYPAATGVMASLVALVGGAVDRGGANPARSIGVALAAGMEAIVDLPVFVLAPLAGAVIAAALHRALFVVPSAEVARERVALREQAGKAAGVQEEDARA